MTEIGGLFARGVVDCQLDRVDTRTFSTWGNSGIEPDEGTGNQLSRNEAIHVWPCNDGEQQCNTMLRLNVSLKQTSICVVNQSGSIVQENVVDF